MTLWAAQVVLVWSLPCPLTQAGAVPCSFLPGNAEQAGTAGMGEPPAPGLGPGLQVAPGDKGVSGHGLDPTASKGFSQIVNSEILGSFWEWI